MLEGGPVMLQEFKKFALRGNVIDLAIGVILGAAFGKIVNSLVDDVIMPPIGIVLNQAQDFKEYKLPLNADSPKEFKAALKGDYAKQHGIATINYGQFLTNVLSFLIIAFSVFLLVRQINRIAPPPPPKTRECPMCCSNIPKAAKRCPNCTSEVEPVTT
jgi:large conductance mechanosensitive channel